MAISNPQFISGAYNKASFLQGNFQFAPFAGTPQTFYVGLATVTGGSDFAGYDFGTLTSGFSAGSATELAVASYPGYARWPLGSTTAGGTALGLRLLPIGTSSYGLYSTWGNPDNAFTASFTNSNAAGGASWNISNVYVFIANALTGGNILTYAKIGEASESLGPQSSLNLQFPAETSTNAIILIS